MNGIAKKILIFFFVMGTVAMTGWFGRKAYKHSTERRLLAQARQYLGTNDFKEAELCLRRALQVNPMSIPATKLVGDMLENAGVPTAALGWRIRVAQLEPGNPTNRFMWAETALKAADTKSAEEALDGVSGQARHTSSFNKLSGAMEWARHNAVEAEKFYNEAARLEPGNLSISLNLDTIHLASTNPAVAQAARVSLEQLASGKTWRLNALDDLEKDAIARRSLPDALKYAKEIANDPKAGFREKIDYLQLLRAATNAEFSTWLAALKQLAIDSPVRAFGLAAWMAMAQGPNEALRWVDTLPPQTRTNQPVPLIVVDCKIALKDWTGLFSLVEKQDWGEVEFYRLAVESLAQRSLGKDFTSQTAWANAIKQSKHRLDRLSRLAQVTASWDWKTENTEILQEITAEFPKEKWAADTLMAHYYAAGSTRELLKLLAKMYTDDPSDARVKNNLATLYMLRKSELDKAYHLAEEAFDSSPKDPFVISTYAYSLLLQKRSDAALQLMSDLKPEYLQIPSIAAYYGVIQAQTGHKDRAKEPLERAEAAKLLPEEKEMVRLAKNGL